MFDLFTKKRQNNVKIFSGFFFLAKERKRSVKRRRKRKRSRNYLNERGREGEKRKERVKAFPQTTHLHWLDWNINVCIALMDSCFRWFVGEVGALLYEMTGYLFCSPSFWSKIEFYWKIIELFVVKKYYLVLGGAKRIRE